MDTKEANKTMENNKQPLIKNICYETDSNKLMINDSENHHYLCDIFGRKKTKFLPYITGMINRNKIRNLSQEKNLTDFYTSNFSTKNISSKKKNNITTSVSTSNNDILSKKKIH